VVWRGRRGTWGLYYIAGALPRLSLVGPQWFSVAGAALGDSI